MTRYYRAQQYRTQGERYHLDGRRKEIRKAIEKSTGISAAMLEAIESGMNERKKHPGLRNFLEGKTRLPCSRKIISRLLMAPRSERDTENLFTEYRVSLNSSRGRVEIVATMRLFRKKRFFRQAKSRGIISVHYLIHQNDYTHEYHQDFLLSSKRSVTIRHSALRYNNNVPPKWKSNLNRKLLARPNTVYL